MNEALTLMTTNFSEETGISPETAEKIVDWFESEGLLDYDVLRETYSEGVRD